ncbi:chemotaxis response regulator protein-glutamate methylesterase [Oceaniserpentilla sp. 4NH20-0058]|uniref:protein-glutamate methylesterase/protein-glutamine glutaminase n=1 Tax=Oceaniserpentilla sp. 4NH20-0058 TaxID=3127660 RepID=UPI003101CA60
MAIRLLVVDDSGFFQKRIAEILKPSTDIKIIGFASNGREAIEKTEKLKPDVITMDYEMPVMDGLTALRNIMKTSPTPVLMFSSLSYDGARVTLDALDAGAIDFLPKNFEDLQRGGAKIREILTEKIKSVSEQYNRSLTGGTSSPEPKPKAVVRDTTTLNKQAPPQNIPSVKPSSQNIPSVKPSASLKPVDLVLIGTSTGGPVALQKVLTGLPATFPKPIILIQHMPASFTEAFAERLDKLCNISVHLAKEGDALKPGVALLAPGGQQLLLDKGRIKIIDGDDRVNYKPCIDITFASAAKHFPGKTLGIILTGMGSDGKDGASLMKQTGSTIWAQDKDSCVIYGMPMAAVNAKVVDSIVPLHEIAGKLVKEVR